MKKAIEIKDSDSCIKCDHCDYIVPGVTPEQARYYINKLCPTCGHRLLTRQAFWFVKVFFFFVGIINLIFKVDKNACGKKVRISFHEEGMFVKKEGD